MNIKRRSDFVRALKETAGVVYMRAAGASVCLILAAIVAILTYKSTLLLGTRPIDELLFATVWNPMKDDFGYYPIILGTIYVTGIAMLIAAPVSVLSSIYVAEYANGKLRNAVKSFVDVLAGIPSVVYGMCAIIILVPLTRDVVAPLFGVTTTGFCILTAGIVLSLMVFPIIISVCVDVFVAVPRELREASAAMGTTKWQTTKFVVLRAAAPGVSSAILLGFGRAFGETIAVAMVIGNLPRTPASVFDSGITLPSIIASTYGELMSVPLYDSAMMLTALILIIIVLLFNLGAGFIKARFA